MPGYFPLSIPPSPPSINIISEISFTIISLSSTDKLFMEFRFCSKRFLPDKSSINVVERRSVPGGYFSELYIQQEVGHVFLMDNYIRAETLSAWYLQVLLEGLFTLKKY